MGRRSGEPDSGAGKMGKVYHSRQIVLIVQKIPFKSLTETLYSFTVLGLPAGLRNRQAPRSPAGVFMDKPRFTVLVVDDATSLREFMMDELATHGIHTIGAADGTAGLEAFLANRERINLVIVDMLMPKMSGLDLAAELERRCPGIKILYISGQGDSIAMESIQRQSAERVLLKPFKQGALMERVTHLLGADGMRRDPAVRTLKRESA